MVLIVYTTRYRKGGQQFRRVAETLKEEKQTTFPEVTCLPIESKSELKDLFDDLASQGKLIKEFHFIGHSGMYGPMFGSVSYPEQFSPYELRSLKIPFAQEAGATFHCCRSARWFAPYFSRVQKIRTYGYHWYTTFSSRKDRFKLPNPFGKHQSLYCFGCPGKKSHGIWASFQKLIGIMKAEPLKEFYEVEESVDSTYDKVADLYAETFKDIKVRGDEFRWITKHLSRDKPIELLDVGCGSGALLKELQPRISRGVGVDVSEALLNHASELNKSFDHISFRKLEGPQLPFETESFDVVISLLSFRYLDWDPIMSEIQRVLRPDGQLLIVDMVTAPVKWYEFPQFIRSKFMHYYDRRRYSLFYNKLKRLVTHPDWSTMLTHNPIRSQHEMKWYLESRFPGRKVEIINIGLHSRIVAFDSINMQHTANTKLSYP